MALRRHLILTPSEQEANLAAAIGGTDATFPSQAATWAWSSVSAWTLTHADIRERLVAAALPFLLFTTFDADGWRLSASNGAGHAGEALHEFSDDWGKGTKGRDTRVDAIVGLLRTVAAGSDPVALRQVLIGASISDDEAGSDLGDLPRVLTLIGAEGIIGIASEPEGPRRRPPRPTTATALLRRHEERPRAAIAGLSLDAALAADLAWLALFCDPDAQIGLVASGRALVKPKLDMPHTSGTLRGDVVLEADGGIGLKANVIEQSARQLAAQPPLDGIILVSGRRRGSGVPSGWHRYAGPVRNGQWHITQATPPVDAGALRDAVSLIGQRRDGGPIACLSPEEAAAVASRCERSLYLGGDRNPRVEGASLAPAEATRPYVIMECFRHRFAGVWDSASARRQEDRESQLWRRLLGGA